MKDRDLDRLSIPQRVAVSAACVEHVADFYRYGDFVFRVQHAPGVAGNPNDDLCAHALALAWSFAETGTTNTSELKACLAGVSQPPANVDPEDIGNTSATFVDAVAQMLRAIEDPTPASAKGAVSRARYTLMSGLEEIIEDQDEVDRLAAIEADWQQKVLAIAAAASGNVKRDLFAALLAQPMPWHPHVATYRAYKGN